jgi:uracil-DNA glycosylase family 4
LLSLSEMPRSLTPETRQAIAERVRYYNEIGIYDFYRRTPAGESSSSLAITEEIEQNSQTESGDEMSPRKATAVAEPAPEGSFIAVAAPRPEQGVSDPAKALKIIREDLGNCTRCPLHMQGRKQIVFGVGNPQAELLFVGEGPGADEDEQGEPFVGRSGQLLTNMIKAMGLSREQVYIANIVKCRPPANRAPEREESETCSPFLMRQIAAIKPKVVVALGATAAKGLLAMSAPMTQLRGRFYDFKPPGVRDSDWGGCKLAVTYHPAFLLRDPRQKGEAWKDLQMVMRELGLTGAKAST